MAQIKISGVNTGEMSKKKNTKAQKTKTVQNRIFGTMDRVVISICIFCILISGAGIWYGTLDYSKAE